MEDDTKGTIANDFALGVLHLFRLSGQSILDLFADYLYMIVSAKLRHWRKRNGSGMRSRGSFAYHPFVDLKRQVGFGTCLAPNAVQNGSASKLAVDQWAKYKRVGRVDEVETSAMMKLKEDGDVCAVCWSADETAQLRQANKLRGLGCVRR